MFQISDIARASLIAGCILSGASGALAQDGNAAAPASDRVADAESTSDAIRLLIEERVRSILASRERDLMGSGEDLSIADIDDMNRQAARARARLELEQTQLDLVRSEIEGLLSLYTTIGEFQRGPDSRGEQPRQDATSETPPPPAPMSAEERERAELPNVLYIFGSGGQFQTGVSYPTGRLATLAPGDFVSDNITVGEITAGYVTFESDATGARYRVVPAPDTEDDLPGPPQQGGMPSAPAPGEPGNTVIDLGAAPGMPF